MNKEFVKYEQALALKELGFDEPCIHYVDKENNSFIYNFEIDPKEFIEWCSVEVSPTPLYQQAFRWFREKYNLCGVITPQSYEIWGYPDGGCIIEQYPVHTYEEAEQACLNKLLEICKR